MCQFPELRVAEGQVPPAPQWVTWQEKGPVLAECTVSMSFIKDSEHV